MAEPRRDLELRLIGKCEHCAMPMPLSGPVRAVTCEQCGRASSLPPQVWQSLLIAAETGKGDVEIEDGWQLTVREATTNIGELGRPPAWLAPLVPSLDRVAEASRSEPAELKQPEPVVMACPGCGASLSIGTERERTTPCDYCGQTIFLPEELWRAIHPVRAADWWGVSYSGMPTSEMIERRPRLEAEITTREAQIASAEKSTAAGRFIKGWLICFAVLTIVLGFPSCLISGCADSDMLFGLQGRLLCPGTCDGCKAPLEMWNNSAHQMSMGTPVCAGPDPRDQRIVEHSVVVGSWLALWLLLALPLNVFFVVFIGRGRPGEIGDMRASVEQAKNKLREIDEQLGPDFRPPNV